MFDVIGVKRLMRPKRAGRPGPDVESDPPLNGSRLSGNRQLQSRVVLGLAVPLVGLFIYFYGIGRNRYFVSSDVVVRKASEQMQANFGFANLLGGGNQQSLEDARYLSTYLQSPQLLEDLEKDFNFRKAYAKKGLDLYAGLWPGATREQVYDAFRRQISVSLDETSGRLRINALAFDPATALKLNQFLIRKAEEFVNRLNQDVYRKQLDFVQQQVGLNSARVKQSSQELQAFQRTNKVFDAKLQATGSEGFISALEAELAKQRVELATLQRNFRDPNAPEVEAMRAQVQELQQQIQRERRALVSPEGSNLSQKLAKQVELEANLTFATDLYKASLASAEKTRVDSLQQQRFMAVLSKPLKPEEPWQYWRHRGFLTALATVLVGFALVKFLLGMADSHRH